MHGILADHDDQLLPRCAARHSVDIPLGLHAADYEACGRQVRFTGFSFVFQFLFLAGIQISFLRKLSNCGLARAMGYHQHVRFDRLL